MKLAKETDPFDKEVFLHVVRLNWRLWTIFQAELSSPDCPLPADVRENVLSLSNFVDKTSVDIIADPQPSKVDILITINRELAAGLFTTPESAAPSGGPSEQGPSAPPTGSIDSSA